MSCEDYLRKKFSVRVGHGMQDAKDKALSFKDDRELLAYLLSQERNSGVAQQVGTQMLSKSSGPQSAI